MSMKLLQPMTAPDMDDDALWELCRSRDTNLDGMFYVAVKSTGVYCRPSCSSRTPKRENVVFFPDIESAEAAGFRACKRCHPRLASPDAAAALVPQVCAYLDGAEA